MNQTIYTLPHKIHEVGHCDLPQQHYYQCYSTYSVPYTNDINLSLLNIMKNQLHLSDKDLHILVLSETQIRDKDCHGLSHNYDTNRLQGSQGTQQKPW